MTEAGKPDLLRAVLRIAEEKGSTIPPEVLERIVQKFTETQFDDDRADTLQFVREISEEYLVDHHEAADGEDP